MNIPSSKALKTILRPASLVYGICASLKLSLYSNNILKSAKTEVPVISVGNITVGGTGKTPITIDLAKRLSSQGVKVAILSRGYKRKSDSPYTVVSDGSEILSTCEEAGDEPYLMALSVPEAVVIAGSNRSETAKIATEKYNCQAILLDDGFQHIKLERQTDFVLLDYNDNLWDESTLPAGRLREPINGLKRSKNFIITKVPQSPDELHIEKIKQLVKRYSSTANIYKTTFIPGRLKSNFEELELNCIEEKRVLMLCAIARPESFRKTIETLGAKIVSEMIFDDHHWFDQSDHEKLYKLVEENQIDFVVTTEKDLVRLDLDDAINRRTYAVSLTTKWLTEIPRLVPLNEVN